MAPLTSQHTLSAAELSYLHTSLSHPSGPLRPDGRSATEFRPLVAETNFLPAANGSARVCWADGSEAIVGVKAEVERSGVVGVTGLGRGDGGGGGTGGGGEEDGEGEEGDAGRGGGNGSARGKNEWVEVSVDVPGYRDDDALPVFLGQMVLEALVADGGVSRGKLWINGRWHWRLYVDILLLSPPLSYPLPLLSLATHLALRSTRLPRLISEGDEDPLFDDDWDASIYLYPRSPQQQLARPPVTLLVVAVGPNIIFDPSREEIAVAEAVVAISIAAASAGGASAGKRKLENGTRGGRLRVVAVRMVDPPARYTTPGIPDAMNTATGGAVPVGGVDGVGQREQGLEDRVWTPPRGGVKRAVLRMMIEMVLREGGVGEEVFEGLDAVDV